MLIPRAHLKTSCEQQENVLMAMYFVELAIDLMPVGVETFTGIFDFAGFSYSNVDYNLLKELLYILQNCYPERLGKK